MALPGSGRIHPEDLLPAALRRPAGGSLFEMHAHSSDRSLDSGVRAVILAEQAAWRGLDGVVLTDHNAMWAADDLRELSERCELTVLAGMELGTDAGHVLVYGLDHYHPELLVFERLRPIVEYEGAAMVLAHPMRPFHGRRPGPSEYPLWFEGIEVINGDHSDGEHGYLARHARDLGLSAVGGSDAHSRDAVGRVATAFPRLIADIGDIVECLRAGTTHAVDFRPRAGGVVE
jgi:predicted metal-dependent phosphoesterase TrpH